MEHLIKMAAIAANDAEAVYEKTFNVFKELAERCEHYDKMDFGSSIPCHHPKNTNNTMYNNCQPETCALLKE